jgi:ribulose kinase
MHNLALGIDVGTSGVWAAAVDETGLRVAVAPAETVARGPTSALARAIALQKEPGVTRVIHQADWISGQFLGGLTSPTRTMP